MSKRNCITVPPILTGSILMMFLWIFLNHLFHVSIYPHTTHTTQNIDFDHISLEHGLSQNNVYCILQDYKGFMWFGTEDGLNMYDGYKFKVFKPDPDNPHSISDGYIFAIFEDRSHTLWIGTGSGGLNRFDRETGRFKHYLHQVDNPNSLSYDCVNSIRECSKQPGILWLGTRSGGLNKFDIKTETFTHYRYIPNDPHSLSHDKIYRIYEDRSGILWIATEGGGLNRFDCQKEQFTRYQHNPNNPNSLRNNFVYALLEDRKGRLWIATDKGLDRFDRLKNQFVHYRHNPDDPGSLSQDRVRFIFEDHTGTMWVGTLTGGLNRWIEETGTFVHYGSDSLNPNGLSDCDVYCIYEDRFHVLWIGTEGGGADKLDLEKKPFGHYRGNPVNPSSLSHNYIWAICESRENPGIVWIGTKGGGLNKFDRDKGTFVHYRHQPDNPHSLSSDSIFAICEDRVGMLWIGTDGYGLNRMDVEKETFTRYTYNPDDPNGINSGDVWAVHEDRSGILWVGTIYGGLNRFSGKTGKFTSFKHNPDDPETICSNDIWAIYEDRPGVLWIGTDKGLNKFNRETGTFTRYIHQEDKPNSLNNNRVLCIYQDSSGVYWIGTLGGGLDKFDPVQETFTHYTEKDGLPSNVVYGILEEGPSPGSTDYHLWLSTNAGLVRFNPRTGKFKNYNKKDGLQGNEFNGGAYHKNKDGEMFFGGINGFNYFHPHRIKDNPHIPPLIITGFQVFDKNVEPGKKINGRVILKKTISETTEVTLSHSDEVISFEFAALHYAAPEENQYAYRMEGLEEKWNYVKDRRFATYTHLPPGDYTFRVKASNNDGVWNEEGTSLKIKILPPWWKTWWFQSLVLLAIVAAIYGLYRLRIRNMKVQQINLEQKVLERTRDLNMRNAELEALDRTVKVINRKMDLQGLFDALLSQGMELFPQAEKSSFLLWDERVCVFKFAAAIGFDLKDFQDICFTSEELEARYFRDTEEIEEGVNLVRYFLDRAGTEKFKDIPLPRSMISMSVSLGTKLQGLLIFDNYSQEAAFDDTDVRRLERFRSHAVSAIARARLIDELTEANKKLQELDRMKTDFLSFASHELRTPLTSVLGFARIIKKRLEQRVFPMVRMEDDKTAKAVEQVSSNVDIILSEGLRLTELINNVLDITKMEAGKIQWKKETVSMVSVLESAREATAGLFENKPLKMIVEVQVHLPDIQGDRDRLVQVFINLISNAVKFTEKGTVTCRAWCIGKEICISVTDTGIGIAEEDLPELFEKFKQVSDTLKTNQKGTGLGLPICKQIVDYHGGVITVESQLGKGTTVTVRLPLNQ